MIGPLIVKNTADLMRKIQDSNHPYKFPVASPNASRVGNKDGTYTLHAMTNNVVWCKSAVDNLKLFHIQNYRAGTGVCGIKPGSPYWLDAQLQQPPVEECCEQCVAWYVAEKLR